MLSDPPTPGDSKERIYARASSITIMIDKEFIAEIRSAAESLCRAADLAETGNLAAAEVNMEEAVFRTRSLLSRIKDVPKGNRPPSVLRPHI
jgi:hypothetical protein